MNKKKRFSLGRFILAPFVWLLQACNPLGPAVNEEISESHFYTKDKSDVTYSQQGNWFELGNTKLGVDLQSFEVLNSYLCKDKNTVYYRRYSIKDAHFDISTFTASTEKWMAHYGMDKDKVYVFSSHNSINIKTKVVEEANPESFKAIGLNWAKDSKNYFFKNEKLEADYESFRFLGKHFCKDKDRAFYYSWRIHAFEADVSSLEAMGEYYIRDVSNIYYYNDSEDSLVEIPYESFEEVDVLSSIYVRVGDKIFSEGTEIPMAHIASFELISKYYAKDKNYVYFFGKLIDGADAITFHYNKEADTYQDKNYNYVAGRKVERSEKD